MQLLKVLARVLEYPTEELQQTKDALVAAVLEDSRLPRQNKDQLLPCLDRLCEGDLLDLQEAYVGTFDRGRATSLLLFEHVHLTGVRGELPIQQQDAVPLKTL